MVKGKLTENSFSKGEIVLSSLREKLLNNQFVVTAEITPPRGPDVTKLINKIKELKNLVDAVNFTDNPSAKLKLCSMVACKISLDIGLEPVLQMTCRDRNRIAIQSDLLGAYALGIRNILVMTGDHPLLGDHKEAKPVYDIDSSIMVKLIKNLNEGKDIYGNQINGKTDFLIGAVVNPSAEPILPQFKRFEQKLKMGAQFFQTQMVFETDKLERFNDFAFKLGQVKIIAGVIIIRTKKMLNYLVDKVPGVTVPNWLIDKINSIKDEDIENFGIDFAIDLCKKIKDREIAKGIHIMVASKVEDIEKIIKNIK